jgi:hypothetical protein
MIDNYAKGYTWENAVDLCKELAQQYVSPQRLLQLPFVSWFAPPLVETIFFVALARYESELFDYAKLSALHTRMAEFFRCMMNQRNEPQYFRVGYYGQVSNATGSLALVLSLSLSLSLSLLFFLSLSPSPSLCFKSESLSCPSLL